jgi:hypothetical protein
LVACVLDIRATQLVEAVVEPANRLITPRTANLRALTGRQWGKRFDIANRVAASTKRELEGECYIPRGSVYRPA